MILRFFKDGGCPGHPPSLKNRKIMSAILGGLVWGRYLNQPQRVGYWLPGGLYRCAKFGSLIAINAVVLIARKF